MLLWLKRNSDLMLRKNVIILFFVLDFILFIKNLITNGSFIHGDLGHSLFIENYLNNYIYLFTDAGSLSNLESINRAIFLLPLSYLFKLIGISETKYLISTIFFLLLFISQISFYVLLKTVFNLENKLALFVAALFYSLSPWVLEQFQAYLYWLAYALMPFFLMYSIKFFEEKKKLKNGLILSILLSFIGTTPQYLIFTIAIFIIIFIYFIFLNKEKLHIFLVENFFGALLFTIIFIILNFYWLYPILQIYGNQLNVTPGYNNQEFFIELFSQNIQFYKLFQGQEQWIYWFKKDDFFNILENPIWIISSFVPIFILGLILILNYDKEYKYFYLFLALFIVFFTFSLGPILPFYKWLSLNAPIISNIGWILRVPGKLSFFIWLFLSICIAIFIQNFKANKSIKWIIIFMLILFIFPKSYAYLTFYYSPVQQPSEYYDLINYTQNEKNYKTIYLAPYFYGFNKNKLNYETSYIWNKDRLASVCPSLSSLNPSIGYYHLTFRNWQNTLYQKIYPEFTYEDPNRNIPNDIGKNYLSKSNVKYLVFHNDIVGVEDKGLETVQILKQNTDLKFVKQFGSYIYLFENPYVKQVIYTDDINQNITIKKINPTKYEFELILNEPSYIYFAQTFDPFWQMTIGDMTIKPEKAFDFDLIKYKVDIRGRVKGEINYFPQYYYEIGLIISGLALFLSIVYLVYEWMKRIADTSQMRYQR